MAGQRIHIPEIKISGSKPTGTIPDVCDDFFISLSEENIEEYLKDTDNLVIFYPIRGEGDETKFKAVCYSFEGLKTLVNDIGNILFECQIDSNGIKWPYYKYARDAYEGQITIPSYFKLSLPNNVLVDYRSIVEKMNLGQNMIFIDYEKSVQYTMGLGASVEMNIISANHCQEGTNMDVYKIIF